MEADDFLDWKNELSQGKASRESRSLLARVSVAQFCKGCSMMWFKKSFTDREFSSADFLKRKVKQELGTSVAPQSSQYEGLSDNRKKGIVDTLCPLMPAIKRQFWLNL
jgi:hypothetical protein